MPSAPGQRNRGPATAPRARTSGAWTLLSPVLPRAAEKWVDASPVPGTFPGLGASVGSGCPRVDKRRKNCSRHRVRAAVPPNTVSAPCVGAVRCVWGASLGQDVL